MICQRKVIGFNFCLALSYKDGHEVCQDLQVVVEPGNQMTLMFCAIYILISRFCH